ncbi:MAG: MFS transporter [Kiloniellales bacterium]|nr:MFS transporter [Kiloniellales bacterium]
MTARPGIAPLAGKAGLPARTDSRQGLLLTAVGSLYVTQGIPVGFSMVALPAILRQAGAPLEVVGMASMTMLPWLLKFLWAPLADRYTLFSFGRLDLGRRRSWILCFQSLMVVALAVIAFLPSTAGAAVIFIGLVLLVNLISATQDIATDGLAVDHLGDRLLGWANSLQIGGFSLGMLLGGPLALVLYDLGGQTLPPLVLAGVIAAALLPVLAWPENRVAKTPSATDEGPTEEGRGAHASLGGFLRRPHALLMLSVAALFYAPTMMQSIVLKPYFVDIGLPLATVGFISGIGMMVLTISASLAGGWLVTRYGSWPSALVALLVSWILGLLWLPAVHFEVVSLETLVALTVVCGLASGVVYVAFFALFMRWARGPQAGTDFTVLQCAETFAGVIGGPIIGTAASQFGYLGAFMLISLVGLIALLWIARARRRLPATCNPAAHGDRSG